MFKFKDKECTVSFRNSCFLLWDRWNRTLFLQFFQISPNCKRQIIKKTINLLDLTHAIFPSKNLMCVVIVVVLLLLHF